MQRAANQPVGELTLYAGIFCKTWAVPDAGTLLPQHAHRHPHLTLVVAGAVRVWQDGTLVGDFGAAEMIKIPALAKHSFLTLTSNVVLACIHAVGEAEDVEVAEEHQLKMED